MCMKVWTRLFTKEPGNREDPLTIRCSQKAPIDHLLFPIDGIQD